MTKQEIISSIKKAEKLILKMERLQRMIDKKNLSVYDPLYEALPKPEETFSTCYFLNCRIEKYALVLGLYDIEKMN